MAIAEETKQSTIASTAESVEVVLFSSSAALMVMVLERLILSERATTDGTGVLLLCSFGIVLLPSLVENLQKACGLRFFFAAQLTHFSHLTLPNIFKATSVGVTTIISCFVRPSWTCIGMNCA